MCQLLRPYELKKTYTGYKVAVQVGKQYFSPFTGVEYRKRKVPTSKPPNSSADRVKIFCLPSWNINYNGYTSVFGTEEEADRYVEDFFRIDIRQKLGQFVLLKITLSDSLHRSMPNSGRYAVAGKRIDSCIKIKDYV